MKANQLLDDKYKKEVAKKAKEKVEKEVRIFENIKDPNPDDIFKFTFEEMTDELKEQNEEIK